MVINGDCVTVMREIASNSIDVIITDPPYGIDFQSSRTTETKRKPKIANDKRPFIWFLPEAFRVLKTGGCLLCFTRYDVENDFRWAMELAGFETKAQLIWDKIGHGMGDLSGNFAPQHENIIFATKGRFTFPGKRPKSVFRHQGQVNTGTATAHPNEKPVPLIKELILAVSSMGETILDPFAGSGSTLIAAVATGRQYVGIEIDPHYVEVANNRLAEKANLPLGGIKRTEQADIK